MEVVCHSAIGHKFVDEEQLGAVVRSAAIEGNKIVMVKAREDCDFIDELLDPLTVVIVQPLHCDNSPVMEFAFIYSAKATVPNFLGNIEGIGCLLELTVGEDMGRIIDAMIPLPEG